MTSYTAIADTQLDQDSPVTETMMEALRDNPIAISEGSANAPVNQAAWHPYTMVTVGDGSDGKIYDFTVDGAVTDLVTPDFVDGYEYALLFEGAGFSHSGTKNIQLYLAASAIYLTIDAPSVALSSVSNYFGMCRFVLPRWASSHHALVWESPFGPHNNAALVSEGHKSGYNPTSQICTRARINGVLNLGKIYMLRRREFITG